MARKKHGLVNGAVAGTARTPEQRYRMIEEAAYYRALQRGFQGGDAVLDWIEAERDIDERQLSSVHRDDGTDPTPVPVGQADDGAVADAQ